ncbi:hypothetical protein R3P38DRAFT_2888061 [Favolaschia claudopus]|uniref:Uncharacterized protein n=1 Tax=Favolaschia claudopus TaxID=2862362 RepID=A0AAW0CPE7_9AGAR
MSLLINGIPASRIARSEGPKTLISASYAQEHFPSRPANSLWALTLCIAHRDPLTVVFPCRISPSLEFDVVLALDWKAHLRDLLLSQGGYVSAAFDPWAMISGVGELFVSICMSVFSLCGCGFS